jgi:hypothetical protein
VQTNIHLPTARAHLAVCRYRRYGSSVTELLYTMPGRLKPLANNVFTTVFITDPLSADGLKVAQVRPAAHTTPWP